MSAQPLTYRVRLAFGFYSVGHTFVSPPMSRAYAETMRQRGYLEVAKAPHVQPEKAKKKK